METWTWDACRLHPVDNSSAGRIHRKWLGNLCPILAVVLCLHVFISPPSPPSLFPLTLSSPHLSASCHTRTGNLVSDELSSEYLMHLEDLEGITGKKLGATKGAQPLLLAVSLQSAALRPVSCSPFCPCPLVMPSVRAFCSYPTRPHVLSSLAFTHPYSPTFTHSPSPTHPPPRCAWACL